MPPGLAYATPTRTIYPPSSHIPGFYAHCGCILASVERRVTIDGGLLLGQLRASYKYAILLRVPFLRQDSGAQVLGGLIFHNWFLSILYLCRHGLLYYQFRKRERWFSLDSSSSNKQICSSSSKWSHQLPLLPSSTESSNGLPDNTYCTRFKWHSSGLPTIDEQA